METGGKIPKVDYKNMFERKNHLVGVLRGKT